MPGLHNLITRVPPVTLAPAPYPAVYTLNWLSSAGTACFLAAIASALFLRVSPRRFAGVYKATFGQLAKPMLTIASMLALAYLMNYSGMTSTLGIALAATGTHLSVLQRHPGMARRVPDRERHVGQRACSAICR